MGQSGDQRVELPAAAGFQLVLDMFHPRQRLFVVGVGLGQLMGDLMVFGEQAFQFAQAFGHRFEHAVFRVRSGSCGT